MKVDVKNIKGEVIDNLTASDFIWKQPMNEALVHQVVVAQLNNKRQGTSNTLRRRDASYSTAKLRAQKGAGRARVGSIRSQLWFVGGKGCVFKLDLVIKVYYFVIIHQFLSSDR